MTVKGQTCLPVAIWYLYSEEQEPLGQVYRTRDEEVPVIGDRIDSALEGRGAEVVEFSELTATCAMRRFRVVVREILEPVS